MVRQEYIAFGVIVIVLVAALAYVAFRPPVETPLYVCPHGDGEEFATVAALDAHIATEHRVIKVAGVIAGSVTDHCWHWMLYDALSRAEDEMELVETDYTEWSGWGSGAEPNVRYYADLGYDIIFLHDPGYTDVAEAIYQEYPDTIFFQSSGTSEPIADHVVYDTMYKQEPFYLAGVVAGYMTTSNVIGFVNSFDFPDMHCAYEAFKLGAESVNPAIEVMYTVLYTWTDLEAGKTAALAMIDAGADVVTGDGSPGIVGSIKAAEERGVYAIGAQGDQWTVSPYTILTSAVTDWYPFIEILVDYVRTGTAVPARIDTHDVYYLAPFRSGAGDAVPQEVRDIVADLQQDINDGTFVVPYIGE